MALTQQRLFVALTGIFVFSGVLASQTPGLTSGEITVQLIQGLDSATNPKGVSQGKVTKSSNPAIPVGSTAVMGLASDAGTAGYTVKLLRLGINGQVVPAASSDVVTAPDLLNRMQEKTRSQGQPQDTASGARVFLPERMIVRFTLTTPPAQAAAAQRVRSERSQTTFRPKGWVIDKLAEITDAGKDVIQTSAILEGTVTSRNRTTGAYLVMHCGFPTTNYPLYLPLEVILGSELGGLELLNAPAAPNMPVDISDFAHSQLGNAPAIRVYASGQNRTTGARVRFFYDAPDLQEIVEASGRILRLSLGAGNAADTTVQFVMPDDSSSAKQMMNSCLQENSSRAQAVMAKTLISCPVKTGEALKDAELTYADTGKFVKSDGDGMDAGNTWNLAPASKGRAPRKIQLTCKYKKEGDKDDITDQEKIAVPTTARSCEFIPHLHEVRSTASCFSVSSQEADVLAASVAAHSSSTAESQIPASAQSPLQNTSAMSDLPAGPTAPVNRLNVRGISVRMGRAQIIAAAKASNMNVLVNSREQLKIVDPTVKDITTGPVGSGLILTILVKDDRAVTVIINEQGDTNGHVFEDLSKKWGAPKGKDRIGPYWGDLDGVYAHYDGNMYGFLGMHVAIEDKAAQAAPPKRPTVSM